MTDIEAPLPLEVRCASNVSILVQSGGDENSDIEANLEPNPKLSRFHSAGEGRFLGPTPPRRHTRTLSKVDGVDPGEGGVAGKTHRRRHSSIYQSTSSLPTKPGLPPGSSSKPHNSQPINPTNGERHHKRRPSGQPSLPSTEDLLVAAGGARVGAPAEDARQSGDSRGENSHDTEVSPLPSAEKVVDSSGAHQRAPISTTHASNTSTDSTDSVPQHQYGKEGWEWMELGSKARPLRDSPFECAPDPTPGMTVVELTAENLKAHEHTAAMAHVRALAALRQLPSPLWDDSEYGARAQAGAAAMAAAAASRVPSRVATHMLDPNAEGGGGGGSGTPHGVSSYKTVQRRFTVEVAVEAALLAAWCAQLVLSLVATTTGGAAGNAAWVAVYAFGAVGTVASILLLAHSVRTRPIHRSPIPCKTPPAAQSQKLLRPGYSLPVVLLLQGLCVVSATVCLAMHSSALAACGGAASFLTDDERAALCDGTGRPLLIPLVCIEAVLLTGSLLRCGAILLTSNGSARALFGCGAAVAGGKGPPALPQ
ncbi:hypothetical protein JKP88DRAFT_309045 [Tribonema minus]|uniref:Transmembrane protein n=1 Tax=Tribonema minus TaxID=303371 RepID=A0A835Z609_9STRA|nr:hypothetical protein JKP88DRAFT_309045 [Tribonema minus]